MIDLRQALGIKANNADETCSCHPVGDGRTLDATACNGRLTEAPACRATASRLVAGQDTPTIRIQTQGTERLYQGQSAALLAAAGRFATLVADHDPALARRARRNPLAAATIADTREDPIATIATETGLLDTGGETDTYTDIFRPAVKPRIANAYLIQHPPPGGTQRDTVALETGGYAYIYDRPAAGTGYYHLTPPEMEWSQTTLGGLTEAYEWLAEAGDTDPMTEDGPVAAVRAVKEATASVTVREAAAVLRKHTTGYGVIEELFADPAVSDVYATAPAAQTQLWVIRDGEQLQTNVQLTAAGTAAIASRLRRESGRSFSRAMPTLDATATIQETAVRVAGISKPATDGRAFAFRRGGTMPFTLPKLIANGTLSGEVAGVLSAAVQRDAAVLVTGARGAGKTTLLGALLWELPATTRTITIEDTPELPIESLQQQDRNVQPLRTALGDDPGITPTEALRSALRLGESALVLGEVRGEEAQVLYEAMRVGASGAAVLGTIHGDTGTDVKQRVTADLGVPESSFAATDLIVTVESYRTAAGDRGRRVKSIEEVIGDASVRFEPLYTLDTTEGHESATLCGTGRIARGNSHLVDRLTAPEESYATVAGQITDRAQFLRTLATRGETAPTAVTTAYARRRGTR